MVEMSCTIYFRILLICVHPSAPFFYIQHIGSVCCLRKPIPQMPSISQTHKDAHNIKQTANAMQDPKPPIQPLHLLTMRARVKALLPIPRLLMFSRLHRLRRHRSHGHPIRKAQDEHRGEGQERRVSV